jgi:hypothetical protein
MINPPYFEKSLVHGNVWSPEDKQERYTIYLCDLNKEMKIKRGYLQYTLHTGSELYAERDEIDIFTLVDWIMSLGQYKVYEGTGILVMFSELLEKYEKEIRLSDTRKRIARQVKRIQDAKTALNRIETLCCQVENWPYSSCDWCPAYHYVLGKGSASRFQK